MIPSKTMSPLSSITAVILAGGLGTRLRSVVPDKPKVMAEINGRPFVEYLLEKLRGEGVRSVILCTGYMADLVENRLGSEFQGMTLRYSRELEPLGTGGAIRLALPLMDSDPIMVLNGDSFCDAGLTAFADWHANQPPTGSLLLLQTDDTRRYGRVDTDDQGRILQFAEKADTTGPGWINAGVYLLSRELIESIEPDRPVSLEREVFPRWIGKGLSAFQSDGQLWDIGVPDAYAKADQDFRAAQAQ